MKKDCISSSLDLFSYDNQAKLAALDRVYGIVEFDLEGTIVLANEMFCSFVGYTQKELIGAPHTMLLASSERVQHGKFWQEVQAGRLESGQFRRIHKNGKEVWLHASYTPITNHHGQLIGVIKLALDITHSRNEYASQQSRLTALYRSQAVIEFSLDGIVLDANTNYSQLTGYELSELIGKSHRQLCEASFADSPQYHQFWETLRSGEPVTGRFLRLGKQGRPFWIQASYNPVLDGDGHVQRVIKYAYDITHNVELENIICRQHDLLEVMFTAHDSFLIERDIASACDKIFNPLLRVTGSEFGFIGILRRENHKLILHIPSITNLSWDEPTKQWYELQRQAGGLVFRNFDNLFGHVITHNTIVCTNEPTKHFASRGTPTGHPDLQSFLGIPIRYNNAVIGMIGLANRLGGFDDAVMTLITPLVTTLGTLVHARNIEDERNNIEKTLRFNAEHDYLTGLLNRNSFFTHTKMLFEHQNDDSSTLSSSSLAMLDIDHFKHINDTYGHLTGDAVLKELATLLPEQLRDIDIIARIGGEEFIVLLIGATQELAIKIMDRCREQVEAHCFTHEDHEIRFTISIGVSGFSPQFQSIDEWLHDADTHLYSSKHAGRNRVS
ncbi:sensor domain-containing diguanylate cyclase [Aeromonas veronii]|uniref:sensor domain-containing diguanylate cyclase n=1 Tax=Aeromonas veronii TaxID=654 RepID=UPI003D1F677C